MNLNRMSQRHCVTLVLITSIVYDLFTVRLLSRTLATAQPTAVLSIPANLRGHMADAVWGSWNSLLHGRRKPSLSTLEHRIFQ